MSAQVPSNKTSRRSSQDPQMQAAIAVLSPPATNAVDSGGNNSNATRNSGITQVALRHGVGQSNTRQAFSMQPGHISMFALFYEFTHFFDNYIFFQISVFSFLKLNSL